MIRCNTCGLFAKPDVPFALCTTRGCWEFEQAFHANKFNPARVPVEVLS